MRFVCHVTILLKCSANLFSSAIVIINMSSVTTAVQKIFCIVPLLTTRFTWWYQSQNLDEITWKSFSLINCSHPNTFFHVVRNWAPGIALSISHRDRTYSDNMIIHWNYVWVRHEQGTVGRTNIYVIIRCPLIDTVLIRCRIRYKLWNSLWFSVKYVWHTSVYIIILNQEFDK